jgi:alpha-amylase
MIHARIRSSLGNRARHVVWLLAAALLAACGGGGGGAGGGPLPSVDTSTVSVADPGSTLSADWRHGVFAQIFVRAYKDSDGDGVGDLQGLTQQLDYLQSLGIQGIWLMPITPSQDGDHGYAVTDYRAIERKYGTQADLTALLEAAHARGIGVILDYVMNHSAFQHPAFTNSRASTTNPFRDWYVWRTGAPSGWSIYGSNPWHDGGTGAYFAGFWDQMPDFNLGNPAVVAWHHDNLRFWLNKGVDGFRFDAVGNLVENGALAWENQPENYVLMNGVRQLVGGYAQRYMVCEAPADPAGYASGNACGAAFAFGHNYNIVGAARGNTGAVGAVANYHKTSAAGVATMVSNHDSFAGQRLWDQVGGNTAQYKLAAATYLLQPGTPFIYYGEEIGMAGGASLTGDPRLRTPMSWSRDAGKAGFTTGTPFRALSANVVTNNVADQEAAPGSILNFYKAMIALRNQYPAVAKGSYEQAGASGAAMSFQRRLGNETVFVAINYGTAAANVAAAGLPAGTSMSAAWPAGAAALAVAGDGSATLAVPAQSVAVYWVRQ